MRLITHSTAPTYNIEGIRDGLKPLKLWTAMGQRGIRKQTPADAYAVGCRSENPGTRGRLNLHLPREAPRHPFVEWAYHEHPFVRWAKQNGDQFVDLSQHDLQLQPDCLKGYLEAVFVGQDKY